LGPTVQAGANRAKPARMPARTRVWLSLVIMIPSMAGPPERGGSRAGCIADTYQLDVAPALRGQEPQAEAIHQCDLAQVDLHFPVGASDRFERLLELVEAVLVDAAGQQ